MIAFEITLHAADGAKLTVAAEDQGQVQQLLDFTRQAFKAFGLELGPVRSRVMDLSELREADHAMLAAAQVRSSGRQASPYKRAKAAEVLAGAVGGPFGAARVLAVLEAGFDGVLPTSVATAIVDGRDAVDAVERPALDPADRVRQAAKAAQL